MILTACGLHYISHQEALQSRIGSSIEDLIAEYGVPHSSTDLPSGKKAYLFVTSFQEREKVSEIERQHRIGYYDNKYSRPYENDQIAVYQNVEKRCEISAITLANGIVESIGSKGEGCQGSWIKK